MRSTDLSAARRVILAANRVAVLTGAGISKESGIPTFRDADGLWRNYRPEELASPQGFATKPTLVWEWYEIRRRNIRDAQPNPAHLALARLEYRTPAFCLITQNVDGLHKQAGSVNVLHLHGSIWITRCLQCGAEREDRRVPFPELPPRCDCGGTLRPGVVWFGEELPGDIWNRSEEAVRQAEVLLVVGTSALVYPAAYLVPYASQSGAAVIEVNPDETQYSESVTFCLRGKAGQILPQLID